MTEVKKLYRYDSYWEFDRGPKLQLEDYTIIKETPCGYWIAFYGGSWSKWVSKTARKRFAYPTPEEAYESYIARKIAYVKHCEMRLNKASDELSLIPDTEIANYTKRRPLNGSS